MSATMDAVRVASLRAEMQRLEARKRAYSKRQRISDELGYGSDYRVAIANVSERLSRVRAELFAELADDAEVTV